MIVIVSGKLSIAGNLLCKLRVSQLFPWSALLVLHKEPGRVHGQAYYFQHGQVESIVHVGYIGAGRTRQLRHN